MGELQPRMRAGDKDRQRVVELLGKHFGEGRLTVEEFDERVVRAHAARYLDEVPALTADLPGEAEPHRRSSRQPAHVPYALIVLLVAMLFTVSLLAAATHGFVPIFPLFLVFLFLRRRRWHRSW